MWTIQARGHHIWWLCHRWHPYKALFLGNQTRSSRAQERGLSKSLLSGACSRCPFSNCPSHETELVPNTVVWNSSLFLLVTASMDQYPNTMLQLWWLTTRLYSLLPSWLILSFLLSCCSLTSHSWPPKRPFQALLFCLLLQSTNSDLRASSLSLSLSVVPLLSKQSSKLRSSEAQKLRAQSSKLKASTTPPAACRSWALMMLWYLANGRSRSEEDSGWWRRIRRGRLKTVSQCEKSIWV